MWRQASREVDLLLPADLRDTLPIPVCVLDHWVAGEILRLDMSLSEFPAES